MHGNYFLRYEIKIPVILLPVLFRTAAEFSGAGWLIIAFYLSIAFGGIFFAAVSLKQKNASKAFEINRKYKLNVFSYIAFAGMFAEFVNRCVSAYYYADISKSGFILRIFAAAFALLSALYFIVVGLYFTNGRYDFRRLKVMHIVPAFWVICRILETMEHAGVDSVYNTEETTKYLFLIAALCFFYCFAREVDNENNALKSTVLFSKELSYYSFIYVCCIIISRIRPKGIAVDYEITLAATAAALCMFSFMFEKKIFSNNKKTENKIG